MAKGKGSKKVHLLRLMGGIGTADKMVYGLENRYINVKNDDFQTAWDETLRGFHDNTFKPGTYAPLGMGVIASGLIRMIAPDMGVTIGKYRIKP